MTLEEFIARHAAQWERDAIAEWRSMPGWEAMAKPILRNLTQRLRRMPPAGLVEVAPSSYTNDKASWYSAMLNVLCDRHRQTLEQGKWSPPPCGICQTDVELPMGVDHRIPLARGGSHHIDNLQWAHNQCNYAKRDRLEEEIDRGQLARKAREERARRDARFSEPPLPPLSCRCASPNPHKDIDHLTRCTRCGRRCLPNTQLTLTDNEATA